MCVWSVTSEDEVKSLSRVRLFVTQWTVAYHAPLSMGFSRQEYWSGLLFPSPGDFPTQGLNLGLPRCRQTLHPLSHQRDVVRSLISGAVEWHICCSLFGLLILSLTVCDVRKHVNLRSLLIII